jgi:hypothetical protein
MIVHTLCMTVVASILALNLTVGVMAGWIQIMKVGVGNQRTAGFQGIHDYYILFLGVISFMQIKDWSSRNFEKLCKGFLMF